MRSNLALSALLAVASAQVQTTSSGDQPTSTASSSRRAETGNACGQIAGLVTTTTIIDAELAYNCLKSVPINKDAAASTVTSLKNMVEWQSTLSYLKTPPDGYSDEAVDIQAGLDDIATKVSQGKYDNEYDFEEDIARLLVKAHDGHFTFYGMTQNGVFTWRRPRGLSIISGSSDGKSAPKIYGVGDFNQTDAGFKPSAISHIDGKDAAQFVLEESLGTTYHDPDSRYNSMFYMPPAENYGYFSNPRFYPGPSVNISYENGTSRVFTNQAVIAEPDAWADVEDGESFYDTFIAASTSNAKLRKRADHHNAPRHVEHPREAELDRRWVPWAYPKAIVEHSSPAVKLAGYLADTGVGKVGVLMIQTFDVEQEAGNEEAKEFQAVVQEYIQQCKEQKISKQVIDLRTNGGGKILLGYDTFLQFFPGEKPELQSRWRGSKGSELFGEKLSSFKEMNATNGNLYTSPFNYHSYISADGEEFESFKDMYPPEKFNNDSFTALLKYNLSDPLVTTDEVYSLGIAITGYLDRANFTEAPFKAEDIIILSDGLCASTCTLFTELMVQQAGVKTIAVGGVPNSGPMQVAGGSKGSMLLPGDYIVNASASVINMFASNDDEKREWREFLPEAFAINAFSAGVNFQDTIRKGLEKDGIPTQFLNDTASCRIYYEPNMYLNVSALWSKAAEVAFGKDGGLDEDACVPGSVTSREQQTGGHNSTQSDGGNTGSNGGSSGSSGNSGSGTATNSGTGSTSDGGGASPSSGAQGAAPGAVRPAQGGWGAIFFCSIVLGSMAFGAGLV